MGCFRSARISLDIQRRTLVLVLSIAKGSVPLYVQIKDLLIARITKGEWAPGDIIPGEIQLARELDVSHGTVRKAITELVENNVLLRRQGRGTFVAIHDHNRALFHFFHLVSNNGTRVLPECRTLSCRRRRASRPEASKLNLSNRAQVVCIERVRNLGDQPTILETIVLPAGLFGDLGKSKAYSLPNALYQLYETQFGITIHRAEEQLRAVAATDDDASFLDVEVGSPLLEIERIALTLDGTSAELRISRCETSRHHYQNTVL